jgi:hypothetical protein
MNDLVTRLLALAKKALQLEYGDPEDRYIYRELQELKQLVQQPQDGPTDEDLYDLAEVFNGDPVPAMRRALEMWGRPAINPVPVSERLPGPEDCDSEGRCWWAANDGIYDHWRKLDLATALNSPWRPTHWLPYHALPLPAK